MLKFVDSDLNFVQDKNIFINPLLQVGSGSGSGSSFLDNTVLKYQLYCRKWKAKC